MTTRKKYLIRLAGIVVFLLTWEILGSMMGEHILAPFSSTCVAFVEMVSGGKVLGVFFHSLRQMLIGYALTITVGIPCGVLLGRYKLVDRLFGPWVSMGYVTSTIALAPLFMILFGIGLLFRIAIVFISSVWYMMLNTYHGIHNVDKNLLEVAESFQASGKDLFQKIYLPATLPFIIAGARQSLLHALRGMVVAELFIVVGFGELLHLSGLYLSTASLMGLLFLLMIVGITINYGLEAALKLIAPWYVVQLKKRKEEV